MQLGGGGCGPGKFSRTKLIGLLENALCMITCCILLFTLMFRVWSPCDIHTPRDVRPGEGVKRHLYKITPTNKSRSKFRNARNKELDWEYDTINVIRLEITMVLDNVTKS